MSDDHGADDSFRRADRCGTCDRMGDAPIVAKAIATGHVSVERKRSHAAGRQVTALSCPGAGRLIRAQGSDAGG